MEARDYKIFRIGNFYHIYNRGNNKECIFYDKQDYLVFLNRLKMVLGLARMPLGNQGASLRISPLPEKSFSVIAYCLMPNHFHFLIRQNTDLPISKLISKTCVSYAAYFNKKYERVGHLFQDQFKAKMIENDAYAKYLSAYIHNNPERPEAYEYSSFPDYVLGRGGKICEKDFLLGMFDGSSKKYGEFVEACRQKTAFNLKSVLFDED